MDTTMYEDKMNIIVNEECTYKELKRDPTTRFEKEVAEAVRRLHRAGHISDQLKDRLTPSYCNPPQMYGLPKVHKPGLPLRPIVSTTGAPTYNLAKEMAQILSPLAGNSDSFVKNSTEFACRIRELELDEDDSLVSFDVVSLFIKVSVEEALEVIADRLEKNENLQDRTSITIEEIVSLTELCLKTTVIPLKIRPSNFENK